MGLLKILTEQYNCDICGKKGNKAMMISLIDGKICSDCFNKLGKGKYTVKHTIDSAKLKIDSLYYDINSIQNPDFKIALKNARKLKTDLLEADFPSPTDERTAIYRGRIYSITGSDSRFPKLPKEIFDTEITLYPFVYGVSEPLYCKAGKEIEFSNRPFQDTRSAKEKAEYNVIFLKLQESATNTADYNWICENLSDIAPKSLSGYVRMKNSNSKNFQILVQKAAENGYTIKCQ